MTVYTNIFESGGGSRKPPQTHTPEHFFKNRYLDKIMSLDIPFYQFRKPLDISDTVPVRGLDPQATHVQHCLDPRASRVESNNIADMLQNINYKTC